MSADKPLRNFTAPEMRQKVDWTFLDLNKPVDVEIGAGVGWHAITYAQANPGRQLIAIEKTSEKFSGLQSRFRQHSSLNNLFPFHADAVRLVGNMPDSIKLSEVFILYPNPSLKNSAQRWIRMPFFSSLVRRLSGDGQIHIASNLPGYIDEVLEYAPKYKLKVTNQIDILSLYRARSWNPRTHFEKKYLERNEPCQQVTLTTA